MIQIHNKLFFLLLTLCLFLTETAPARAAMQDYPIVKLQSLDKVTARTMVFEAKVGSTVKFGPLYIKIQSCRKAPPIEKPESASFLQIWEITTEEKANWIFSGWMFASSPSLSSMDHPIYDVWIIDCLEGEKEETVEKSETDSNDPTPKPDNSEE